MPSFRPEARIAGPLAVLVALGAPFLGGSVEPWSQGLVLGLFALGFLIVPPERAPHRGAIPGLLFALLLASMAFFPSGAFEQVKFRQALEDELGIPLALTNSPQPWISLEGVILMVTGILWWWWLITVLEPTSEDRARIARWSASGMIGLAALSLAERASWLKIPLWPDFAPLGPFPNKNQMGDLLGTWGVVTVACGVSAFRKRRWTGVLWMAGAGTMLWALLGTASRGGVAAFICGLILWGLLEAAYARRLHGIAIALAAGLCGLAVFFTFGGETFQRSLRFFAAVGESDSADFRIPIFRDAMLLIHESPWCGLGLGNFEPVFALYRDFSAVPSRVIHPESDWLWLVSEMGWLAPVIAGILLIPSLRHSFRPSRQPGASVIRAAAISGVMFLLHGLVDVSGHRLGSAIPGLMLLALGATPPDLRASSLMRNTFRITGAVLLGIGLAWFFSRPAGFTGSTRVKVELARQQASVANAAEKFREAEAITSQALAWAPLAWELYFQRGVARIYQGKLTEAHGDFRRARRLEPSDPDTAFREGELWVYFDPARSREAWTEALRRAAKHPAEIYGRMLSAAAYRPEMRPILQQLATGKPELRLRYLSTASADELTAALPEWLETPEELQGWSTEDRARLFTLWSKVENRQALVTFLEHNPHFLAEAWRPAAEYTAQQGDVRGAVRMAFRAIAPPALPHATEISLEAAQRDFILDPSNVAAGYGVFRAELALGRKRDALATVDKLSQLSRRPAYLPYLRAQVLADLEEWDLAWKAIQEYHE